MSRVLFLLRRYCPGEAWTNRVLAYAKSFAEDGAEVYLYYLIFDKKRTKYNIDLPGVKVVNLFENDGFLAKRFRHISFIKNLISFKKLVKPGDVYFVYGGYEYQLYIANLIKHKAKVFCEITEHPNILGNNSSIKRSNARKIKLLKKIDGLFVISKSLKEYYVSQGIDSDKIHIINMFVDVSRFIDLRKTVAEKYVAYCGAVSYSKDGCDTLIRAFNLFHKKHTSYKLYIIGKGVDGSILPSLQKLAKELQIADSVIFTGAVPPEKIPQLLFNASILALARPDNLQAKNGFPTKLGEYLATGNPVVVTKVGEIPDFIKHKVNGLLAEPDNPADFAANLCWIADNPVIAQSIGEKGKELVLDSFNSSVQAKKALQHIRDRYKVHQCGSLWRSIMRYRGNFKGLFFYCCYSLIHPLTKNKVIYLLTAPLWLTYRFIFRWILGIDIPERVKLGKWCIVNHGIGLVINPNCIIGDNVKLHQNTTIGTAETGGLAPIIGNNVTIGANSIILGNIRIGDNATIAAGSVVINDVPQYAIVAGNPATIKKFKPCVNTL